MGIIGSAEQALIFLQAHWGSRYQFTRPGAPGEQWTALARFGQHDQIHAWLADELLELVRAHSAQHRVMRDDESRVGY